MKKLIIFGAHMMAEMIGFYFRHDSNYEVVAYCVDDEYRDSDEFDGLPLVPFEYVDRIYSPDEYEMFVALSYSDLNRLREKKYSEAKAKGYRLASYVHTSSVVAHNVVLGDNTFILENCVLQVGVVLGNNITLWNSVSLGHHVEVGDNCFISINSSIGAEGIVGNNTFIGMDVSTKPMISIGRYNIIGMRSLLLADTEEYKVYTHKSSCPLDIDSRNFDVFY